MKKKTTETAIEATGSTIDPEVQVLEILKDCEGEKYEWLLITQQHIFPCEATPHDTKEDLIYDLANAQTCHCSTVAIFHQGRRLTPKEIASLEKEALDGLGPISKARAQGKI